MDFLLTLCRRKKKVTFLSKRGYTSAQELVASCSLLTVIFAHVESEKNIFNLGQSRILSMYKEVNSIECPEPNPVNFGRPWSCRELNLGNIILIILSSSADSSMLIILSIDLQFLILSSCSCSRLLTMEYENRNFELLHSSTVNFAKV